MKRSRAVPLTLVASAASAAALAGCARSEPMRCVEKGSGRVVADSVCTRTGAPVNAAAGTTAPTTTAGGIPPIFLWYYGGRVLNGLVSGGGYAPLAGRSYRSPGGYAYDRNRGLTRAGGGVAGAVGTRAAPAPARPSARGGFGGVGSGRSVFS